LLWKSVSARLRGVAATRGHVRKKARTYGGKSAEDRENDRKERLLEAGLALFGTEGYASTSIERICSSAGVTARHFYELFESREALLKAVYDRIVHELRETIWRALAGSDADARERIRQTLDAFVHAYLDDPRKARVAVLEVVGVSAELERHRLAVGRTFADVVRLQAKALSRAAGAPPQDFRIAAIAMAGGVNDVILDWLSQEPRMDLDELVTSLANFFLAVIEGARLLDAPASKPPTRRSRSRA
jgi:AcrR family transcriptional regulator